MSTKELNIKISTGQHPLSFNCSLEGEGITATRYQFITTVPLYYLPDKTKSSINETLKSMGVTKAQIPVEYLHYIENHAGTLKVEGSPRLPHLWIHPATNEGPESPIDKIEDITTEEGYVGTAYSFKEDFLPILSATREYSLSSKELLTLNKFWFPNKLGLDPRVYIPDMDHPVPHNRIDLQASKYFGELLEKILEKAGYVVTVEVSEYYFPSPTTMGLISPAFSLGLQKNIEPVETKEAYETEYIYLSVNKPQSKTEIQLKVFDAIPEERLRELQRSLKDNLSPYGLKCLYLAIEECGHNKRNPWFILNTNRCLDLMGYARDKRGIHYSRRKARLLKEFEALTRINFNIERREPKGKKNKDMALKFTAPLLSITGKFEEWEVDSGQPIESGKKIKENIQIFLHSEIYKYMNNWYTIIPVGFLKIDARSRPRAILLYSYIANQWRIGWHQYQGTIKQTMRSILEGAGLLSQIPRHTTKQRKFIEGIKDDLRWLKDQKYFWIKSVRIETKNRPFLEEMVIIRMADDHPLRAGMKNQIGAK